MAADTEHEFNPETAALIRTLVDKIPAMVAYWDKNQRCRFANRAYEKWFGVRPEAVMGRTMKELLGPLYPLNLPHIERVLRGEEQEFEREIPDPAQGPPRYSQAHYIPHVVDGEIQGFCVLVADITRRKRAEEALQAAQRQLEARERLAAMATLAAGIAHEINNPLAAVLGNVELALEALEAGSFDAAALQDMLGDARSAANRVSEIVRSMRLLVRGDAVPRERINVADCIEQSIAFAANSLRYRARLIRELAPELYVAANAAQLSQVVVNLLANAAHALPEDTPRQNEIRITARREGDQVLVEVADNGRGIPEELQSRIFEPFFSTRNSADGMGLGLSISRNIVEEFGGAISFSSRSGRGSIFRVLLPCAPALAAHMAPSRGNEQRQPSSILSAKVRSRVLIVDDEDAITGLLTRALAGEAYDVTVANSGRDAIDALKGNSFDLVLCDLMMPEMSGEDVYREAKRICPQLARRFVFLTGGAFTHRGRQFLASVPAPVLEKPFRIDQLLRLVSTRLRGTPEDVSQQSSGSEAG
jgi:PAS domain S-box-containing protein